MEKQDESTADRQPNDPCDGLIPTPVTDSDEHVTSGIKRYLSVIIAPTRDLRSPSTECA